MNAAALLRELAEQGISLSARGERLQFEAPAGVMTDALREQLREHKQALLAELRISRETSGLPLSPAQESFWLLEQLNPGSHAALEQFQLVLRGRLDLSALSQAWQQLQNRHPVLRLRLVERADGPLQRVAPKVEPVELTLQRLAPAKLHQQLREIAEAELSAGIDLYQQPPLRARLLGLPEAGAVVEHRLLVTAHHLVADGISVRLLQSELAELYRRNCAGTAEPEPANDYLQMLPPRGRTTPAADEIAALDYWRQQLAGMPNAIDLPRVSPGVPDDRQRRLHIDLPPALSDALRELARNHQTSLFVVLLAGLRALLARLAHQADFGIGTAVTGRDDEAALATVGCFVNNLVLRSPVEPEASFTQLLVAERDTLLAGLAHRQLPFQRLVAELNPPRRAAVHPLFQVLFLYAAPDGPAPRAAGVEFALETFTRQRRESFWELELSLTDSGPGQGLSGYLGYAEALFEADFAAALPARLAQLLSAAVASPALSLAALPLLLDGELDSLRRRGCGPELAWSGPQTLHELVREQVRATPERAALVCSPREWTYLELQDRADSLAGALQQQGLAPGDVVGLALEASPDRIAAVLAVLACGGILLPLDPTYPKERLSFMLGDAGATLLLTDAASEDYLPGDSRRFKLNEFDWPCAPPSPVPVAADAPAFLLYTSGSTGQPKGAVGVHRDAVRRCAWMWQAYGFDADEVFCQRTSLNFIDSLWEIFGALGRGARLVIPPRAAAQDPEPLLDCLAEHAVTHLVCVPTVLRALLAPSETLRQRLPALRSCITSGEPLPPDLLRRWRRQAPDKILINTYGMSEVWDVTHCKISNLEIDSGPVPIGSPLAGVQVWLLDEALQPVPPGVVGELCVAGFGSSAGYWRRPELNAERFPAHPLVAGERIYRSGDLARWRPDGFLECLGRRDQQVKLRGLRIELTEVESALRALPGVLEAGARIDGQDTATPRLLAWLVGAGQRLDLGALRSQLRHRLPAAMLPARLLQVDSLPLTPSGKLDRRRLVETRDCAAAIPGAQLTATEQRVAEVWAALLDRPVTDAQADFFALGGHSLLAAQLMARLREEFQVQLQLGDLFTAPTVAGLAAALERHERGSPASLLPLPPRPASLPLSFGQQRLWFLEQLDPGSPAYHIAFFLEIEGALDLGALTAAATDLTQRHEALRSVFISRNGKPSQQVLPACPLTPEFLPSASESVFSAFARRPFDIERGPLLRLGLVQAAAGPQQLLLVVHHLVSDGRSSALLFRDLAALYASRLTGAKPDLPPLPLQYVDFAIWQRRALDADTLEGSLAFWRQELIDAPAALTLAHDYPRPAEQRFRGGWLRRKIDGEALAALQALGQKHAASLPMVLLSAYYLMLRRYSAQADILIGSPVQGRPDQNLEEIVGLFVNTLIFRINIKDNLPFDQVLGQVRETTLAAQAEQALPFEKLVEALQPARSLSRAPLFQAMFNFTEIPATLLPAGSSTWRLGPLLDHGVANFDLSLNIGRHADGAELIFEYDRDLFAVGSIAAMADVFLQILAAARTDAGVVPELLSPAARIALLALNPEGAAVPSAALVLDGFARFVDRQPHATATQDVDGRRCSYAQLNEQSLRVAAGLRQAGIRPGDIVALLLPAGSELLAGLLGVLRSGAIYLPLDVSSPPERLAGMLDDARPVAVLTRDPGGEPGRHRRLLMADLLQVPANLQADHAATADEAAYALFTSGSSGRPKAVLVSHGALAAAAASWRDTYALQPADRHLQMANPAFDVFSADWVRALTSGASLVFCPRDVLLDAEALDGYLRDQRISCAEFVPAVLRGLLTRWSAASVPPPHLRLLAAGSEPWFASEYRQLRAVLGAQVRLINSYGVAEATVDSSWYEDASGPAGEAALPIGQPFAHARLYVCGADLSLQPPGVPGELCIGGAGIALGYLHQPELTAERFVADPFSSEPGARLYRTGDRARWRADGQLELLGRMDRQVKLRGFRIELGEIEAALAGCAGVQASAVELLKAPAGEQRLVAWVVASTTSDELALRAELAERLPDYMLPTAWVFVPALPLTPNGKLDRAGLPAPDWQGGQGPGRAAATPLEALIGEVMSAVLGVSGVQATDDFFALGGHSLLATQLISRLRDALGLELELRAVFTAPTPAGLAASLSAATPGSQPPRALPRDRERWPVSPAQRRLWFLAELNPASPAYHLHWSLRLDGKLDPAALQAAVEGLQARHESLRTCFVAADGEPYQLIAEAGGLPVDFAAVNNSELSTALRDYVEAPFVLSAGPLWRVGVFSDAPDSQVLVLVIHHIVADGWSLSLLFRELSELYAAALEERAPQLAELPLQYVDYALWQQERLSGPELTRQLDYWRARLAGAPAALPLPGDHPGSAVAGRRGAWLRRRFDGQAAGQLQAICKDNKVTNFIVLLTIFKALLARWAGVAELVVGTPVAGRSHSQLEGLVGFFVNTLPLRGDLSGNPNLVELLARVRSTALDAFAHPDLPFERIVEALSPTRVPGRHPITQVLFVLHNQPRSDLALADLQATPLLMESEAAKFDLSLHVAEDGDGFELAFNYDPDLFDASTLSWLSDSYLGLLRRWPSSPQLRLSELSLPGVLPAPSLPALPAFSQATSLGAAFAARAALDPKALAVASGAQRWSYGALLEVAHRVAQGLLAGGGTLGDRVGLVAHSTPDGVAGLLGILLAGRAYVPLDPAQPVARLRRLLATAGCRVVVASDELLELAEQLACPLQRIDSQADGRSTPALGLAVPAETLAYLMFTSGSTGEPKAVMQSHAGVLSQVARYAASLELCADDRLSQLSSFAFDASVQDVFGALLSGASLHPLDVRSAGDGAETVDALVAAEVSVVHATPTVYRHLFGSELSCRHALTSIRAVVLGGELARRADFALFCTRFARGTRLVNGYGLTESTVVAQWQGDHDSRVAGDWLPLGQAVAGISIELWDEQGQPSWQGEIVLRGSGLAQGYWGDEPLTAARFADGVYRTGDLGRWQADGQLAFVGRRDDQVKLRGVRVSLLEVEQCLAGAPGVSGCAVSLRSLADGQAQLVAYVSGPTAEELAALQRWAVTQLAPWQLPAAWVVLDALPRRANGKLDRDRLPAPQRAAGLPPRTELERALAGLWSELLGVERIRREDDFFALGGHSLMATRLIARIRQNLRRELPLRSVFESPVLAVMAEALAAAPSLAAEPELRRLPRGGAAKGRAAQALKH